MIEWNGTLYESVQAILEVYPHYARSTLYAWIAAGYTSQTEATARRAYVGHRQCTFEGQTFESYAACLRYLRNKYDYGFPKHTVYGWLRKKKTKLPKSYLP